jgi:putative transposase
MTLSMNHAMLLQPLKAGVILTIGRPMPSVQLSPESKAQLEKMANSRSLAHALVRRATIVLMAAEGINNQTISQKVGLSGRMVGIWRQRFLNQGIMGLYDEFRPGAPRTISDDHIAGLIRKTLKSKPTNGTHWTCRSIEKQTGLSRSTV